MEGVVEMACGSSHVAHLFDSTEEKWLMVSVNRVAISAQDVATSILGSSKNGLKFITVHVI